MAVIRFPESGEPFRPAAVPDGPTAREVATWRAAVLANGWQPVAVRTRDKAPVAAGWQARRGPLPAATDAALNTGILASGLRAVDVDTDDPEMADAVVALVEATAGPSPLVRRRPNSPRCLIVYRVPDDAPVPKAAVPLACGGKVEILGHGQQFVAHGLHPTGAEWEWPDRSPADMRREEAPQLAAEVEAALLDELRRRFGAPEKAAPERPAPRFAVPPRGEVTDRERAYAARALDGEAADVASTMTGGRNDALNRAALRIGHYVGAGWIGEVEVRSALTAAAEANGLVKDDGPHAVQATITSGLRAGIADPAAPLPPSERDALADEGARIAAGLTRGERVDPATGEVTTDPAGEAGFYDPWARYQVPAFPLRTLPHGVFVDFVEATADQLGACQRATAMAVLAACSGAIDHRFRLRMQRHGEWKASPRLWVLLVGDPSRKKTPVIDAATGPIEDHDFKIRSEYLNDLGQWEAAHKAAPQEAGEEPREPTRYLVGDTTTEKLAEILSRQSRGVLVKRDELSGWIGSMEKYSGNGGGADRAFWLQSYNGGRYTQDRVKRGTLAIENLSTTIIGGIQPERLAAMRDLQSDGLLQRFLPVMMAEPRRSRDEPRGPAASEYRNRIRAMLDVMPRPGPDGPRPLEFAPDAWPVVERVKDHLFDLAKDGNEVSGGFAAFAGKLEGVFGSIALIHHMAGALHAGAETVVSAASAEAAAQIVADFVVPHALEFYRTPDTETEGDRVQKIASFILTEKQPRYVASDFTRKVWCCRGLGLWDLNKRLSPLLAGGWLRAAEPGPVSRSWIVTPGLYQHFAERAEEEARRMERFASLLKTGRWSLE